MDSASNEADQLRRVLESRLTDVFTAIPGTVKVYDPSTMTATVQPAVRQPLPLVDDPDEVGYVELPAIPNVPICFMRGGGCSITFRPQPGDSVLLVFTNYSAQGWRDGNGETADAGDTRMHHPGSAFAIPCVAPDKNTLAHAADSALVLEGATVKAGADADSPIARAIELLDDLTKIAVDLDAIVSGVNGAFPGTVPAMTFTAPNSAIAATKGFVK